MAEYSVDIQIPNDVGSSRLSAMIARTIATFFINFLRHSCSDGVNLPLLHMRFPTIQPFLPVDTGSDCSPRPGIDTNQKKEREPDRV